MNYPFGWVEAQLYVERLRRREIESNQRHLLELRSELERELRRNRGDAAPETSLLPNEGRWRVLWALWTGLTVRRPGPSEATR